MSPTPLFHDLFFRFGQTAWEGGGIVDVIGSLKVTLGWLFVLEGFVSTSKGSLGLGILPLIVFHS